METIRRFWTDNIWSHVPGPVRKPLVLVVGTLVIIAAPFTGILPGPGGIPVFLIGVAILSTEFEWAKRLRDWTLAQVKRATDAWRRHKVAGSLIIVLFFAAVITASIFSLRFIKSKL